MAAEYEPVDQLPVHGVGADDHLAGSLKLDRPNQHRAILPTAQTAMAADEALERGHLVEIVEQAVDVDVGRLGHQGRAQYELRGLRTELGQRILADHDTVAYSVLSLRPAHHGAEILGVDDDEPDSGMVH